MLNKFKNTFSQLPSQFYSEMQAQPVQSPNYIDLNTALAETLGLDTQWLQSQKGLDMLSGSRFSTKMKPLSMVYAGHQFGNWVPQLGDGRAVLLGEVVDKTGVLFDIQLKGSGPTPYSRGGDGRAGIGPVLIEYLLSEALHKLGVPTTRSLAAVLTGENVQRQALQKGAVLTRVARTHIRIGTFEYFSAQGDKEAIQTLVEYALQRLYPERLEEKNPAKALFEAAMHRQAQLIARWQLIGFIHGVMNTDNCTISGETIDYGPCAFMDVYQAKKVFSSIDHQRRYAYCNQPTITHWNLAQFAYALLPAIDDDIDKAIEKVKPSIDSYPKIFQKEWLKGMRNKLGLFDALEEDLDLAKNLFAAMEKDNADFTNTFQLLIQVRQEGITLSELPAIDQWVNCWQARLAIDKANKAQQVNLMRAHNPVYIPRNHQVHRAIKDAERGDYQHFKTLQKVLSEPYTANSMHTDFSKPPTPDEIIHQTFCGT